GLQLDQTHALTEVAKALTRSAIFFELLQDRRERGHDFVAVNQVLELEIKPLAQHITTNKQRELVATAAHDANFAWIRPYVTVGAASHADVDFLVVEIQPFQLVFQLVNDAGQRTLRFRDRQAASRNRGAGHAVLADRRQLLRQMDAAVLE